MPLTLSADTVIAALTFFAFVFALPFSITWANGMRLIDQIAYVYINIRYGKAAARRHLYHPLHRFDLLTLNTKNTTLFAHGNHPSRKGTPFLTWTGNSEWLLYLAGDPTPIYRAAWNDLDSINTATELLGQPSRCTTLAAITNPQHTAQQVARTAPKHTLNAALKDLRDVTGDPQAPLGGVAQLVRYQSTQKPVAVLLTLPQESTLRRESLIQGMSARGWNHVTLNAEKDSVCLTLLPKNLWEVIAFSLTNPTGNSTGHRRW